MCGRWELPALPAQFCCETKTAIKIKSLDKNKELYKCTKNFSQGRYDQMILNVVFYNFNKKSWKFFDYKVASVIDFVFRLAFYCSVFLITPKPI